MSLKKETVTCDKCGNNINFIPKELDFIIQHKIKVEGFICPNCKQKYITVVTDNKLRANIYRLQQKRNELEKAVKAQKNDYESYLKNKKSVPDKVVNRWEQKIVKLKNECDELLKNNIDYEKQLRGAYKKGVF